MAGLAQEVKAIIIRPDPKVPTRFLLVLVRRATKSGRFVEWWGHRRYATRGNAVRAARIIRERPWYYATELGGKPRIWDETKPRPRDITDERYERRRFDFLEEQAT